MVRGVISSNVLKSFVTFHVGPTRDENSKLVPLSVTALTETIATLHGCYMISALSLSSIISLLFATLAFSYKSL